MTLLTIERMGNKGDGLGEGKAVPRTLPHETVELDGDKLKSVIKRSPDRVKPFCSAFDRCGGCKLQHWKEKPYREWKRSLLIESLQHHGVNAKINEIIDAHDRGRRRATFHVRKVHDAWRAGFMEARSHALVPLETCPILVPELEAAPQIAATFGAVLGNCDVSVTAADSGLDVAIKSERKLPDSKRADLDKLMRDNRICRLALNGEMIGQLVEPAILVGSSTLRLPVGSFLQATARGENVLASLVLEGLGKAKHPVDLFCGVGPFTLRIAISRPVMSVDSDARALGALEAAKRTTLGLRPIALERRDLFKNPLTPQELKDFDAIILDPPRAGASAQCEAIAKSAAKKVIYVSCDVETFARDAALLQRAGFVLKHVTPVDQFKYSAHLEIVGHFARA